MMRAKHPLARRIAIAFTLMTLVVSGIFSLSIVGIVHFIEEHLISEELSHELDAVLHTDISAGQPPRLAPNTRFYASNMPEYAIPELLLNLNEGFTEVVRGDEAYYAYSREIDGQRYLMVKDQHEFEAREQVLFNVVLAGFLLSIGGAWLLGQFLARRVMAPVSHLAQQVGRFGQLDLRVQPLALQYPDDEVGHLAAAFDTTLGQLRRTLERERLFTSDVSHELRTPLMIISSASELLREGQLSPQASQQMARIERAAKEMRDLVQTFLMLARDRPEENAIGGSATLPSVVEEQGRRWGELIRAKGLHFDMVYEDVDNRLYNLTLLRTVISNLLRNALHYTEQGWVRLIVEGSGFRVEDSGVGIPSDQQAHIFEPFVRGELARGEGLGLGLSLVKRICAHQGWQVAVSSQSPRGSCFRVSLAPTGAEVRGAQTM